jgi:hypothetical protein
MLLENIAKHRELNFRTTECFEEIAVWVDDLNIPLKEGSKAYKTKLNGVC